MKGLVRKVSWGRGASVRLRERTSSRSAAVAQPSLRLVAIHFVDDALLGEGRCAGIGPDNVAVGMVAMGMGVEDEQDRFGRELVDVANQFAGAAGVIGINDDEVVLHLDDDVVAITLRRIAEEKPDAVGNFERVEGWVGSVCEGREEEQEKKERERGMERGAGLAIHGGVIFALF